MEKAPKILGLSLLALGLAFAAGSHQTNGVNAASGGNKFVSDYESREDVLSHGLELRDQVEKEGVTLIKNDNNALPLQKDAKVSIFSKNSDYRNVATTIGNTGLKINPTLKSFYADNNKSGLGRSAYASPTNGNVTAGYLTGETPVSMYTEDVKSSFAEYNDAAIVIIYRQSGEGNDAPRTMKFDGEQMKQWNKSDASMQPVPGARSMTDHYLQLDQNEADMLAMVNQYFDKIVVLIETPSAFEAGFLDDPGHYAYQPNIKAAMYLGQFAYSKPQTIGKILCGDINPSGRLVDTFARDFKTDPTWMNFGNNLMEIDSAHKGNQYENLRGSGGNGGGGYRNNYVTYSEGIYSGYRYWETRGFTEGNNTYTSQADEIHGTSTTTWDNWYDAHVVYPYGHGLSYSTFTEEIISATPSDLSTLSADSEIEIKVKVTNTGTRAGKDVVELYYTAPYIAGQVEKSHVVLGDFTKTDLLEPNQEQIVTLKLTAHDMASFDYGDLNNNNHKGYELDAGQYQIKIMKNAHEVVDSVSYTVSSTISYDVDPVTNYSVTTRFEETTNYITDELHQNYLSRNDWEGTWPVMNFRLNASQNVIDGLDEWKVVSGVQQRPSSKDETMPYYSSTMPTTGVPHGLKLVDMYGLDYDDPQWDLYLDQLTVEQLTYLVCEGRYECGFFDETLGLVKTGNYDTRYGIYPGSSGRTMDYTYSAIGEPIILAMTWNKDLAQQFGDQSGEVALWSKEAGMGIGGWYAPSINIHRSQFGGRNHQYYGEDPLLAGRMASRIIMGAQGKGLPTFLKHFAVNNQETNRCGLITWLDEQNLREVYLKGFEICVKEGKTLGIMSSLNRIGTEWAGGSYDLLTEVLRNEWGFRGSVVTDSYLGDTSNISNADHMIRGGGNLALGHATLLYNVGTTTTVSCSREMAKGTLYLMANSNSVNVYPQGKINAVNGFIGKTLNTAVVGVNFTQDIGYATVDKDFFPDGKDEDISYYADEATPLPDGLSVSQDGIISGKPTQEANNYKFNIIAEYLGIETKAAFTISIIDKNGSIVYQCNNNLGEVEVGQYLNLDIGTAEIVNPNANPEDEVPEITYSLTSGSKLLEGLTLSNDGKITGTPTKEAKDYEFGVIAKADGYRGVEIVFKISVLFPISFEASELPNGKIGVSYLAQLPVATSQNTVKYRLANSTSLPFGLELTDAGYIVGTPTTTVTDHTFDIMAYADFGMSVVKTFKISIGINYNKVVAPQAFVGEEYELNVDTAQGAVAKYALANESSLPDGLTLTEDGMISGTPTKAGKYTITIVATANGKLSDSMTFTLVVSERANFTPIIIIGSSVAGVAIIAVVVVLVLKNKKKKVNPVD